MFKWINAKDMLPSHDDHIIMVNNHDQIFSGMGCVFNKKIKPREAGLYNSDYYTHWMLLPEPPERDV